MSNTDKKVKPEPTRSEQEAKVKAKKLRIKTHVKAQNNAWNLRL